MSEKKFTGDEIWNVATSIKTIPKKYHHVCYAGTNSLKMVDQWHDKPLVDCPHKEFKSKDLLCETCNGKTRGHLSLTEKEKNMNEAIDLFLKKLFQEDKNETQKYSRDIL